MCGSWGKEGWGGMGAGEWCVVEGGVLPAEEGVAYTVALRCPGSKVAADADTPN